MEHKLRSSLFLKFCCTLVAPSLDLAVADSGCTSHLLFTNLPYDNKVPVLYGGKRVKMHNGETMVATHTSLLPLTQLPVASPEYNVFPALQQRLLSLGQLFNAGFTATLEIETIHITKDGIATLSGNIYHSNGVYFIPIQGCPTSYHFPLPQT